MVRKRKRRKKGNKTIVIIPLVGIVILLAIALYFNQPHVQKKTAEEYFKVLDPKVLAGEHKEENVWKIYHISFKLQAIGGDAHNVIIQSWAMADPQELFDIPKNESRLVILESLWGDFVEMNNEGKLPVSITITSDEAEGKITIAFSPPS